MTFSNENDERKTVFGFICFFIGVTVVFGLLGLVGGITGAILFAALGLTMAVVIAIQWTTFKLTMQISERLRAIEKKYYSQH